MINRFIYVLLLITLLSCGNDEKNTAVPPSPEQELSYQTLTAGPLQVAVDPAVGGRIASFKYEGREILKTSRDTANLQWGSTVWTAPQSDWNWPPPTAFDQEPFDFSMTAENRMHLYGRIDPVTKLQVIKSIRLAIDESRGPLLTLRYQVYNRGEEDRRVAVWENTRLPFSGEIRYAPGGSTRLGDESKGIETVRSDGDVILVLDEDLQPDGQKLFYDVPAPAKGRFLYNTYENDGLAFLKSWRSPTVVAPGQAPLEIYLAPSDGFAELEVQGEYKLIGPKEFVDLIVFWQLFPADELQRRLGAFR